jgi:hypothetical protein
MRCPACRHDNPAALAFCRRCGIKLDFTADEIEHSLAEKARTEAVRDTAAYARHALFLAVVLLLVAVTLRFLAGGTPEEPYVAPSAAQGARYLDVDVRLEPELPKLLVPVENRSR